MDSKNHTQVFPEIFETPRHLAMDRNWNIFVGHYQGITMLTPPCWQWIKYLWIGYLKEHSSYCLLAGLPREIIKEIAGHIGKVEKFYQEKEQLYEDLPCVFIEERPHLENEDSRDLSWMEAKWYDLLRKDI